MYRLHCDRAEHLWGCVDKESIACAVFSPPYNINAPYGSFIDQTPWADYVAMANQTCHQLMEALMPGGRVWVNVQATVPFTPPVRDGKNRQTDSRRMNLSFIWELALREAGFSYRDTIVWIQDSHDGGTAWGSYRMPSAPNLRGSHELILNYFKEPYARKAPVGYKGWKDPRTDDWPELTRNVWKISPSRDKEHTATYPVELPSRAVRLSTWPEETVLDPFAGSGTTGIAAVSLGRNFIGLDVSEESIEIAERRIAKAEEEAQKAAEEIHDQADEAHSERLVEDPCSPGPGPRSAASQEEPGGAVAATG